MVRNQKNTYPVFKEKFRSLMLQRGVSQADISKSCGLSNTCLSFYFYGTMKPTRYKSYSKLCTFLDVSPEYLLDDSVPFSLSPPSADGKAGVSNNATKEGRSLSTYGLTSVQIATLDTFITKLKNNEFSDRACVDMLNQWLS